MVLLSFWSIVLYIKRLGFIPGQGTYIDCGFNPQLGHDWCFSLTSICLSFSPSLPFSLKPINILKFFLKREVSLPNNDILFLDVLPIGFQSQAFCGLISPVQDQGYLMWNTDSLLLRFAVFISFVLGLFLPMDLLFPSYKVTFWKPTRFSYVPRPLWLLPMNNLVQGWAWLHILYPV